MSYRRYPRKTPRWQWWVWGALLVVVVVWFVTR